MLTVLSLTNNLKTQKERTATEKKQLKIALELQRLDSISATRRYGQIDISMERLYNNLDMLRLSLGNLYVKAPSDGQLSSFSIEVGQMASSGEHLGQIDNPNDFKLRANIDERYISRVNIGQEAAFDFNGNTYELTIDKIYTDVTSGSFQVDLFFSQMAIRHTSKEVKRCSCV